MLIVRRACLPLLLFAISCKKPPPPPPPVEFKFAAAAQNGALPLFGDTPFPDDQYLEADGSLAAIPGMDRLVSQNDQLISQALDSTRGFGLTQAVYFFTDGDLDPASLPQTPEDSLAEGASAFLAEIDLAAGALGERVPIEVKFLEKDDILALLPRPGVVLKEGTTYLAVITDGVRALEGEVRASEEFLRLLESDVATLSGPEAEIAARLQGALALVDVVPLSAAVFTTGSPTGELLAAAEIIRQAPAPRVSFDPEDPAIAPFTTASFARVFDPLDPENPPSLLGSLDDLLGAPEDAPDNTDFPGLDNPGGLAHDAIGLVTTGVLFGPRFQQDDDGTDGPNDETFRLVDGVPEVIEAERPIPFTVILPDPEIAPPPPGGYPVVIATHGLDNSRRFLFAFANTMARAGVAVVGIDLIDHGSRFSATDVENSFFGNAPYEGPDGLGDVEALGLDRPSTRFFENFSNFPAVRDNIRQSALDLVALHRVISSGLDLSEFAPAFGGVAPVLDGERVAYLGNSLGTIVGTLFLSAVPEIEVVVLNVPGGGFINTLVANSPSLGGQLLPLALALVFGNLKIAGALDSFYPLFNVMQIILDPADPLSFARFLSEKQVLILEVLDDTTMPNQATRALAEALGVELLGPVGQNALRPEENLAVFEADLLASGNQGGLTRLLVQVAPATHSDNLERRFGNRSHFPHLPREGESPLERFPQLPESIRVEQPVRAIQAMIARFVTTGLGGGAAEVEMTTRPVPDFDGDGFCDEEEEALGADPFHPDSTPGGEGECVRVLP